MFISNQKPHILKEFASFFQEDKPLEDYSITSKNYNRISR